MLNIKFARFFFGISILALGIQFFIFDYVAPTKPPSTSFLQSSFQVVGFLYTVGNIALGAAVVFDYRIKVAAFLLGVTIFSWALFRHVPLVIVDISDPGEWNSLFMAVAASGSAFIIADSMTHGLLAFRNRLSSNRLVIRRVGNLCYGSALIVFGVQHIVYAPFIASLIPSWIPGNYFWAYVTGLALFMAGISIIVEWKSNISSLGLGIMISLWIALVHVPRLQANARDYHEWTSLFQAVIITSGAFVLRKNLQQSSRVDQPIRHARVPRASKTRQQWQRTDHGVKSS
jgi:uncharacterized membrane protein